VPMRTPASATIVAVCSVAFYALFSSADLLYSADLTLLWPPSPRSAPALSLITFTFMAITIYIFVCRTGSAEQERVRSQKRKLIMAQLVQAMRWDEELPAADDAEEPEKRKEKKPPEIKELFEMLFDDVEEVHVTTFGIDPTDTAYAGVLDLFRTRLTPEIEEATRFTAISNGIPSLVGAKEITAKDDLKRLTLYRDGAKLRDLLELHDKKIRKRFGALVPKALLRAARNTRDVTESEQRRGGLAILFSLVQPHLPLYFVSSMLMAFDSSLGAATWHSIASLLDGVDNGSMGVEDLKGIFLQTYVTLILCIFAHLTSCAFTARVSGRFANSVKSEVLRGILRKDTVFFDVYPCGVIQERLNHDAQDLSSKCFHLPMQMLHNALMIASNAYAVYRMKPELLWLCLAPIPFVAIVQKLFIRKMEELHRRGRKVSEHVVANTNETIKELRTVRSFAMEAEEADTYAANSQYRNQIEETTSVIHHCLFIAPLVVVFVGTRLMATYLGGGFVAQRLITVGMAVQIGNAADHLQHCMRTIVDLLPEIFKAFGPVGRICEAINSRPSIEPYPGMPPKLGTLEAFPIVGHIEFIDVEFTFPSEPQKQILHGLSFNACPGEKVAFVGPTGCGKSTAIQLIQRFYSQSNGQVLLDGQPIESFDVHYLRRKISVVAQDNVLFSTTIRENVTYGLPRVERDALTDADIEAACRRANAWTFINGFPRKLETFCGERGVKLSGGQKQRLAIARAIIRKPTICLLDEATSALDSRSELVVQKALDQMIEEHASGCTLVIAHRLSTVKNCDRILVMDSGRVVESGTHDELLAVPIVKERGGADPAETAESARTVAGIYHELWNTQMGGGIDDSGTKDKALDDMRKQVAALQAEVIALRLPEHPSDVELTTPEQVESMQEDQKSPTASQTASDTSTEASDAEDGCE